jgi:enoyl-CoA hydratase/carnithine racemase
MLGGIYRVAECAGKARAIKWALTSEQIPARVMEQNGVIYRIVPDATLLAEAAGSTRQVAAGRTRAHAARSRST